MKNQSMTGLSVILITQNEERNVTDCLETVRWANEIVVVDAGSTDGTVERAKAYTSHVHVRPWEGYGEAKNFALSQCRGPWILWIDADERVTPQLAEEIQGVLAADDGQVSGYSMPRKANFLGRWIHHGGWYPGRVIRLFRKERGRFTVQRVHEQLLLDGPVSPLRSDLLHYTDPDLHHYFAKFNKYTSLAAEEMFLQGKRFRLPELLTSPPWRFVQMYILRRGFLDGLQGFVLAVVSSAYVFVKYAKLWELEQKQRVRRTGE